MAELTPDEIAINKMIVETQTLYDDLLLTPATNAEERRRLWTQIVERQDQITAALASADTAT